MPSDRKTQMEMEKNPTITHNLLVLYIYTLWVKYQFKPLEFCKNNNIIKLGTTFYHQSDL